jgi:phage/plasmid-associated DNA primase
VKANNGKWHRRPQGECKHWLQNQGLGKPEADCVLGGCVNKPWELVNQPFKDEYPGGRKWNYNAPQFKYTPANVPVDEAPNHPHWDKILQHCFCDLDEEIKKLHWAQELNIRNGYQYGLAWVACCFRDPFEPLPFLFFFGNQDCGKSIFHEALSLLVTSGVVSADRALINNNNFNGELAGGVLAVVEEKNISGSTTAYNRIKEWVTGKMLWIRKMRTDAYAQPNTLHFVMMANNQNACPVLPGDTRIVVIEVPDLLKEEDIPKEVLLKLLEDEAPAFMHTLLNMELPQAQGRLHLPVVDTYKRQRSQDMSRDSLEAFIHDNTHYAPGEKILFSDFFDKFIEWMDTSERFEWSKTKVSRALRSDTPSGSAGGKNQRYVGNLSWEPAKDPDSMPLVCSNGRLKQKED